MQLATVEVKEGKEAAAKGRGRPGQCATRDILTPVRSHQQGLDLEGEEEGEEEDTRLARAFLMGTS